MSRVAVVLAIMLAAAMIMMVNSTYAEGEAGIKLDKKILNLETGETVKLEATITPEGGNLDDVKWSSACWLIFGSRAFPASMPLSASSPNSSVPSCRNQVLTA